MSEIIKGTIENIIYRNEANGYTVMEVESDDGLMFVAVGDIPLPENGENVELTGIWTEHKTYGRQFKVLSYTITKPETHDEIIKYLSSGSIRGIGESTARLIVNAFGNDTFDVLDNHPEKLLELPGIGKVKYKMITESYVAQRGSRGLMLQLQKYDITTAQAVKLIKKYGDDCLSVLQKNPYRLIDDIEGIGFKIADKIARNVGIEYDSPFRVQAGIKFILEWAKQEGHTYLPYDVLISATEKTINIPYDLVKENLDELLDKRRLVGNTINDKQVVFLPYMRQCEMSVATKLIDLDNYQKLMLSFDIDEEIDRVSKRNGIELEKKQKEALRAVFTQGVVVITGGPGTGKTTILRVAIEMMDKWGMSYELAAPTGRAAKRMTAATGKEARTIHRLLEYCYTDQTFLRDENDPLDCDFVIIDEMSMVDVSLMSSLLKAITGMTRLVFVGDADQLPSVGAGNVLGDILNSDTVFSVRLTEVYRQAQESMIVSNAHKINSGIYPELCDDDSDFNFTEITDQQEILDMVLSYFKEKMKNGEDLYSDVQLLAPMKKGLLGVYNMNKELQKTINPPSEYKAEIEYGETIFRIGDKVMQIKNNYSIEWVKDLEEGKGIFNGDIGIITNVDKKNTHIEVTFEDGAVADYSHELLSELELAYCISIHKSQGSEFPTLLLALFGGPPTFMTRNLLYTAVTRAKKKVIIIGRRECVYAMVDNKNIRNRYSALRYMLEEYRGMKHE